MNHLLHSGRRALTLALLASICLLAPRPSAAKDSALTTRAKQLLTAYSKKDYKTASKHFDSTMKKAFPPEKMKAVWQMLESKLGKFQQQGATRTGKIQQYDVVYIATKWEKIELDCKIVFNSKQEVSGFFFVPKGSK